MEAQGRSEEIVFKAKRNWAKWGVVAVIDAGGCALVRQEMDGPFESPQVEKPNFIETAAGPIINIFKGTARLITGEKCDVFYNGSVAAPEE